MGYSRDIWFSVKISFWGLKEFKYFSRIFFNKEGREYFEKKREVILMGYFIFGSIKFIFVRFFERWGGSREYKLDLFFE